LRFYLLFRPLFRGFLKVGQKFKNIFVCFFGSNENFKICFRDLLTFNKDEIETINNLSTLIDTQDQEIAQKDLEIRVMKNNGDCGENIEIIENLFTEIDVAKDQLERKNHESTILKKELARRIKENIFNKEEIVKKTEKINNQDEIIAMNDKKIAKMDQEITSLYEEMIK
jgi:hypothetical protein